MYTLNNGNKECAIIRSEDALKQAFEDGVKKTESTFFELKYHKKLTLHFYVKPEFQKYWEFFNYLASELRDFPLPDSEHVYKRHGYSKETNEYKPPFLNMPALANK